MTTKGELLRKIRQHCSECMGGPMASEDIWPIENQKDVADCTAPECAFYDFRFGKDPRPNKRKSELGKKMARNLRVDGRNRP